MLTDVSQARSLAPQDSIRRAWRARFADIGRWAVLIGCVFCVGLLCVFAWAPAQLDAYGISLRERRQASEATAAAQVLEASRLGPANERKALLAWQSNHDQIRKLDVLIHAGRWGSRRLVALAEQRGDIGAAIVHARHLVEMDDRDIDAVAVLGRLLSRDPKSRAEAYELLHDTWRQVPDSPALTVPYCKLLVDTGKIDEAVSVLHVAAREAAGSLWGLRWSNGGQASTWLVPRRVGTDGIEARCKLAERRVPSQHHRRRDRSRAA